jgi:hypothetical protein
VPVNIASGALIATGALTAAGGAADLGRHAATDDSMTVVLRESDTGGAGAAEGGASSSSRGSTGRTTPGGANEARALELAREYPEYGDVLDIEMKDPEWPAKDGWVKMSQDIDGVEIHYNYNTQTCVYDDFKIKDWSE